MAGRLRFNLKDGCKARMKVDQNTAAKLRRAENRATVFASFRNITACESPGSPVKPCAALAPVPPPALDRRQQLEKWKKDKEEKEKLLKAKEKPIFKLRTVINHTAFPSTIELPKPSQYAGMITRSRTGGKTAAKAPQAIPKRQPAKPKTVMVDIKADKKFVAPKAIKPIPMLTIPQSPIGMSQRAKTSRMLTNMPRQLLKSKFAEAKSRLVFSAIASAPSPTRHVSFNQVAVEPVCAASPNITVARGNFQQRKRSLSKPKLATSGLSDEISATSVMNCSVDRENIGLPKNQNIMLSSENDKVQMLTTSKDITSATLPNVQVTEDLLKPTSKISEEDAGNGAEDVKDAKYYRNLLDTEIARLQKLCELWSTTKDSASTAMSEEVQGVLDSTIGHTQLLIRSKFEQFRGLTVQCEAGTSIPPILVTDLEGFWEMLLIQVDNLDREFKNLDSLKSNGWQKKQVEKIQTKKNVIPKKPIVKTKPVKPSGIKALMLAARKKQMADSALEEKLNSSLTSSKGCIPDARLEEIKATPERNAKRMSLLQGVLSSNVARKAERNSPIVMRVSLNAKTAGMLPVAAVNSHAAVELGTASPGISRLEVEAESVIAPTVLVKEDDTHFIKPSLANPLPGARLLARKSMSEGKPKKPRERKRLTMLQQLQKDAMLLEMQKTVPSVDDGKENETFVSSSAKVFTPRRSLRLTPYKNRRSSSVDGRPSLMPMDNLASPLPLASGELICFDTPPLVRRSTRLQL